MNDESGMEFHESIDDINQHFHFGLEAKFGII